MHAYRQACGKKVRSYALAQTSKVPGAGVNPKDIVPYSEVFMDGFMLVECVKDRFFEFGDKFGKNKFSYNVGESYNTSIVRYTEMVPKEDREPMNHDVCFRFCRTVPDMKFFGLAHGRDCYCAPFYETAASDSSDCDEVCEGNPTEMCGGKVKSSMFAMHLCQDTREELDTASDKGSFVSSHAGLLLKASKGVAEGLQKNAAKLQEIFGAAGDPVAGDIMQTTKVWAGKVQHANDALGASNDKLVGTVDKSGEMDKFKFQKSAEVTAAEDLTSKIKADTKDTFGNLVGTKKLYDLATRGMGGSHAAQQYYPLMYFVDKKYEHVPSTCGGDYDKRTIYGVSVDECAAACDAEVVKPECVGFSWYEGGLCILFSKFTSVTYYTECGDGGTGKDALLAMSRSKRRQPLLGSEDESGGDVYTKLSFSGANLVTNNLNGKGPGSGASEMRFENVGTFEGKPVTLVITSDANYAPQVKNGENMKNKLTDAMASISFGCNVDSVFTFSFVDGSGSPLKLPAFDFSVFDFDTTNDASPVEEVTIGDFDHFFTAADEQLQVTKNSDGTTSFSSTYYGQGCDNPTDPDTLDTVSCKGASPVNQAQRSVGFRFLDKSTFKAQFSTPSSNRKCTPEKTGRFMLFGLASAAVPEPEPQKDKPKPKEKPQKDFKPKEDVGVTKCYAKLEDFVSTNLNPNQEACKSGKNKLCLKEATKAARCFK
jgi:hypothetical protein